MAAPTPHQSPLETVMFAPHLVADADDLTRKQLFCSAFAEIRELHKTFITHYENPAIFSNHHDAFVLFLRNAARGSEDEICEVVRNNFQDVIDDLVWMKRENTNRWLDLYRLMWKRKAMDGMDGKESRKKAKELCADFLKLWKRAGERLDRLRMNALELRSLGVELGLVVQEADKEVDNEDASSFLDGV